jgi:hypothetical protein
MRFGKFGQFFGFRSGVSPHKIKAVPLMPCQSFFSLQHSVTGTKLLSLQNHLGLLADHFSTSSASWPIITTFFWQPAASAPHPKHAAAWVNRQLYAKLWEVLTSYVYPYLLLK